MNGQIFKLICGRIMDNDEKRVSDRRIIVKIIGERMDRESKFVEKIDQVF